MTDLFTIQLSNDEIAKACEVHVLRLTGHDVRSDVAAECVLKADGGAIVATVRAFKKRVRKAKAKGNGAPKKDKATEATQAAVRG